MIIAYGIDFGTTNTAVVGRIATEHGVTAKPYGENNQPFPSLVALHPQKSPLFGMEVKRRRGQLRRDGYVIISSFKSVLGRDKPIKVGGKNYSPLDVAMLFLKYVKESVEKQTGIPMTQAAISIPVDYNPLQRHALRQAAEKAGILVQTFVSEPTAAYIRCREEIAGASNIAVFDWGGGTLDVSILTVEKGIVHELAIDGKAFGGNNIDEMIARHIHARIMRGMDAPKEFSDITAAERDEILNKCEEAKKVLSTQDDARIRLMNYGGRPMIRESISLEEFQSLTAEKMEEAARFLLQTASKAGVTLEQLDAVLMVGGSCEMRPIVRHLEKLGGDRVYRPDNVQWVVAGGAAVLAEKQPVYRLERDFGVLLSDGSVYPVFKAGDSVPCESEELSFGVVEDTTNAVFILADSQKEELHRMLVPVKGFTSEGLRMRASIDRDMIAYVSVHSTYMERTERNAKIYHLGFVYHIE